MFFFNLSAHDIFPIIATIFDIAIAMLMILIPFGLYKCNNFFHYLVFVLTSEIVCYLGFLDINHPLLMLAMVLSITLMRRKEKQDKEIQAMSDKLDQLPPGEPVNNLDNKSAKAKQNCMMEA